jgi:ATPase subunit of ABC transporter with duplicated ATPase domains
MITANDVTVQFGKEALFKDVNISFTDGNCYGLIGANGSGKSTFLKVLAGELEPTHGTVDIAKGQRLSVLKQDHFAFDEYDVLTTVIMGHKRLYAVMQEKDALYAKLPFTDEDGHLVGQLEEEFGEIGGWTIDSEAERLLDSLGIPKEMHTLKMKQLEASMKVRVLLAQALVGNPDVLLLDEPTNHLDMETCMWLEEFLIDFNNTAVVVSHDRHFLDKVCTHIADIDFGQIQLYSGNYTFWSESSQLALRQRSEKNKKIEDKRKELEEFIARFSANASKSRQATSRKKTLEKLNIDEIKPSIRRYPYMDFRFTQNMGNELLNVEGLSKKVDGEDVFKDFSMTLRKGEKIGFLGRNDLAKTMLFEILADEAKADSGIFKWGDTAKVAYFPKDSGPYFETDINLIDWLRQYSDDKDENHIRSFLGKMLFGGDDALKSVLVLSGGEKVRCMLAKIMLTGANVLVMDEPTNHLDLESITALNQGLERFAGCLLLASHDHQLIQSAANRIIEITPAGFIDKPCTLDEYLQNENVKIQRAAFYASPKK